MKHLLRLILFSILVVGIASCHPSADDSTAGMGGSVGGGDGGGGELAVTTGLAALQAQDLDAAEAAFCGATDVSAQVVGKAKASGGDGSNTPACFGCAMVRFFKLWESDPVNRILQGMGEQPLDVDTQIFGETGLFAKMAARHSPSYLFNGEPICYNNLPFIHGECLYEEHEATRSKCNEWNEDGDCLDWGEEAYIWADWKDGTGVGVDDLVPSILCGMKANGYRMDELRNDLMLITAELASIKAILVPAVNDADFNFTIPKELFHGNRDVAIDSIDLKFFSSGFDIGIFATTMATFYDIGVGPQICIDGKLNREAAYNAFNAIGSIQAYPLMTLLNKEAVQGQKAVVESLLPMLKTALTEALAVYPGETPSGQTRASTGSDATMARIDWAKVLLSLKHRLYCNIHEPHNWTCWVNSRQEGHEKIFKDGLELVDDLQASMLDYTRILDSKRMTINLGNFFADPPGAGDVPQLPMAKKLNSSYEWVGGRFPFVPVDTFWKKLTEGFVKLTPDS